MIPTKPDDEPEAPPPPELDPEAAARDAALRARLRARPIVTWVLLGVQFAMFLVEMALGGSETIPVLAALGGLSHDAVARGEVWRLVSSAFLHAGFLHVALNSYVLFFLGTRVEQMLGSARMLVLYTASTIGAGLMAYFTSSALITVGASGGIFGLLAAEAIFVFTARSTLLPAPIRAARQRGAIVNLFLNVGISLQPHVSLSAHAGGAIVGAAMILLGFAPADRDTNEKTHPVIRALAGAAALVLAAALVCGVTLSGSSALGAAPELTRTQVPEMGWSFEMPSELALQEPPATTGTIIEAVFGDLESQAAVIAIARIPRDDVSTPATDAGQMTEIETVLRDQPPEGTALSRVERTTIGVRPAVRARYSAENGLVYQRLIVVRVASVARIDTLVWPGFDAAYLAASDRVAASIEGE